MLHWHIDSYISDCGDDSSAAELESQLRIATAASQLTLCYDHRRNTLTAHEKFMTPARPLIRLDIALIVAVMLLAFAARIVPGPRTIDDAFITFRYSRNIVEGQGFVYNPGLQSLGTTTPLSTLLLAAISFVARGEAIQSYAIAIYAQ